MGTSEKVIRYVNRSTDIDNKFSAVGSMVIAAENKRVTLRGLREAFEVTDGVISATGKTVREEMRMLIIQEAASIALEGSYSLKPVKKFPMRISDIDRNLHFCNKKGLIKVNCFWNPNGSSYKEPKEDGKNNE